jgi:hypothetical protein
MSEHSRYFLNDSSAGDISFGGGWGIGLNSVASNVEEARYWPNDDDGTTQQQDRNDHDDLDEFASFGATSLPMPLEPPVPKRTQFGMYQYGGATNKAEAERDLVDEQAEFSSSAPVSASM